LRGEVFGEGEGRSKKHAEQAAARAAWERVQQMNGSVPTLEEQDA